jgi:GABA permease
VAGSSELQKGLNQRQLMMIAIGGVIGAGLFVGSGVVIKSAGPGAFLTYLLTGVMIIMVMRMLGEMATPTPRPAPSPTTPARRWAAGPGSRSAGCTGTSG